MSFVVLIAVIVLVVVYVRASRRQRLAWVTKLDLIGRWQWDSGDQVLTLAGEPDHGSFVLSEGEQQSKGIWQLRGHDLVLVIDGETRVYDLRLFRPGCIGLKDESGLGRVYEKLSDNVVSLATAKKS